MAIGTMPATPDAWGRWTQSQPAGADFDMMQAGMVPYDCRTATSAHISRPELPQHFLPTTFSSATPIPSPASPQYHAPVSYAGYNPYSAPSMLDAPFKLREPLDRMQPRCLVPEPATYGGVPERVDGLPFVKRSCSPSVKTEANLDRPSSPASEYVAPTTPAQATTVHQFNTAIDNVMRVIEAKREILEPTNETEPAQTEEKKEATRDAQTQRNRGKPKRKRFCCDIPGCTKMFAQKNNLDTHRRSHTGESPYVCPYCQRRFTQSVNLKTHINRHTGERPYECPECDKCFPQLSNVKAHMRTHIRRELRAVWAHQNTYHVEEIEAFNAKLAAVKDKSMISEEDKEMAKYLVDVHNLANKGIKGRGKGRKVKRVLMLHPPQHQTSPSTSPVSTIGHTAPYQMNLPTHPFPHMHIGQQQQQQQHQQQQQQQQPLAHSIPYYGLSNPAAYSMSRSPNMVFGPLSINTRDPYGHGVYGMDSDQLSDASSAHGSPHVMHAYEDEHGRELAFGERIY
ncbi:C2H2 transcription factor [Corynascus similis CBS 632.67]